MKTTQLFHALLLAALGAAAAHGQAVHFDETFVSPTTTDYETLESFQPPTDPLPGPGATLPGRVTIVKLVTDAPVAEVDFELELSPHAEFTRNDVKFAGTNLAAAETILETRDIDGVQSIIATAELTETGEPAADGHVILMLRLDYDPFYDLAGEGTWTLRVRENSEERRYFGFVASGDDAAAVEAEVTRPMIAPDGDIHFGRVHIAIEDDFAPLKKVGLQNVGTAELDLEADLPTAGSIFELEGDPPKLAAGEELTHSFDTAGDPDVGLWVKAVPTDFPEHTEPLELRHDDEVLATVGLHASGTLLYMNLVVDLSGSMQLAVGSGSDGVTRLEALQAGALAVNQWFDSFTSGRGYIGLSCFPFPDAMVPVVPSASGGSMARELQRMNSAFNNSGPITGHVGNFVHEHPTVFWTPMESGIEAAIGSMNLGLPIVRADPFLDSDPLTPEESDLVKTLVLFTDGYEQGDSDAESTIPSLRSADIEVISIGLGTSNAVDLELLQKLAGETGEFIHVEPSTGADELRAGTQVLNAFKEATARILGLEPIVDPAGKLRRNEVDEHFACVDEDAYGLSFTVDWNRQLEDGVVVTVETPYGELLGEGSPDVSYFKSPGLAILNVRGRRVRGGRGAGEWTLRLRGGSAIPADEDTEYAYSVLVQSSVKAKPSFPNLLATGYTPLLELELENLPNRLQDELQVRARVTAPSASFRTHLADAELPREWFFGAGLAVDDEDDDDPRRRAAARDEELRVPLDPYGDGPGNIVQRKAWAIENLTNEPFVDERVETELQLYDDGTHGDRIASDGIYSAELAQVRFDGVHSVLLDVLWPSATPKECLNRQLVLDEYALIALTDATVLQGLHWTDWTADLVFDPAVAKEVDRAPREGFARKVARFEPADALGNKWGPGHADDVAFRIEGGTAVGPVIDNWDGTYLQVVEFSAGTTPSVRVSAGGATSEPVVLGSEPTDPGDDDEAPSRTWLWLLAILVLVAVVILWSRRRSDAA